MPTRLIGLTRKSKGDDEGTHADQAERIRGRLAREDKLTLVNRPGDESDPFYEHKVSGGKDWRRRAFGKAIEAIRAGNADGIIVAYEDRVSREGLEAAVAIWKALGELEAIFIACDGVDSRQEGAEFTFNLKAAVAAEQLRLYKVRSNDGRRRAVEKEGVHAGREAPLGYLFSERASGEKNVSGKIKHGPLVPDPETADRIPEAFRARVDGRSWNEIVGILGLSSQGTAYQLLRNRVYLGEARSGEYVKVDAHPALIDRTLFDRVQETFGQHAGRKQRGNDRALLARVLICDTCGRGMVMDRSIGSYRCKHYGCAAPPSIKIELIEPEVMLEAVTWHAVLNPMYEDARSDTVIERLTGALSEALEQRDEILAAEDELDPLQFARAMTKAGLEVEKAEARLREAEEAGGWFGLNTETVQRRLFGEVAGETFSESFAHLRSTEEARDFIQQMVRVRVRPVGSGSRPPVSERIDVELLVPKTVAPANPVSLEEWIRRD